MYWLVEIVNIYDSWRLQKDGSWRQIDDIQVYEGDRKFWTPDEVDYYYALENVKTTIGGETVIINPRGVYQRSPDHYRISARLVRMSKPKVPNMKQLRSVILAGNDAVNNSLVLLVDGNFELIPLEDLPPRNARIAVRYETFAAGNDYVGQGAAADDDFIRHTYTDMLDLWLRHLRTGRLNIWDDTGATKRLEDILKEIELVTAALK